MALGGGTAGQAGSALGAGVYSAGPVTFNNCTLYNNEVTGGPKNIGGPSAAGAAIYNSGLGQLSVFNCTVTGNKAPGGDIVIYDEGSDTLVRNCTIAGNEATGLYLYGGSVGNSIVASNGYFDLEGYIFSSDFNLFGTTKRTRH